MKADTRPVSPHLQIYAFRLHMAMSISHRITGVALIAGTALLMYWLWAAASGPDAYAHATSLIGSPLGKLLLAGWSFALFYHVCNGIRHLFWDAGKLFEIHEIRGSGIVVLIASIALTALAWGVGMMH
ncbi:succinate dehydrogenase, cytochrome b556 subunit [Haematospirillum jordaniae]|uniref:Succinate dehydrogenase cytochrome b556 subunit n=1 Tax=Haematospirillum jordaniae TaxID=1549855 RepID=A0A143DF75_9PROT|nr:succinate dehydrogenase, cytochrome b556 subunit [Haematospirillum jordaniae]AMW35367.1 succinate dehydrogenase [Haematospirillum jordaniae]NKD45202.1 succinate dehydrogenase, cytochrome b556 subunit [Haematospirillum jordaniae]NKD56212.1 succinate dehydrogenase, cytochrome b556 subunit [Haematospirillum jordaniae]NKD58269.1 succinate dehydrogenase, cytochrome b556 subunit [Haematospirillum jordaniae]NKD66559.1 succinate dehydrogenase, cytochrome b556 subunit [Haematospirillum jordaniae]